MHFGFFVTVHAGQIEFRLFGDREAGRPPLVTLARRGDCCLALMGRLDYQDELRAQMGDGKQSVRADDDGALALAAYERWGEEAIGRLEGEFSLVLYDVRQDLLLAARDPQGGYPLFWTTDRGVIALASSLRPILDLLPQRSLNPEFFAEYQMLPVPAFQEVPCEASAYQGIHRLRGGTVLRIAISTRKASQRVYWNWLDKVEDPGTDDMEPIAEELAHRLRLAVRQRLRGRVAAHFSGGMDSTAVALIARDLLLSEGKAPLDAISLVFERLGSLVKETAYIESALCGQPGIEAHRIPADSVLDYDIFDEAPPHEEPFAGLRGLARDKAMADKAAEIGADTILTGVGADDMFDMLPYHIAELLRLGRIGQAWREARRWAAATNSSPWLFISRFGLGSLVPARLRAGLRGLLRGGSAGPKNLGEGTVAPGVRPEFAGAPALRARGVRNLREIFGACRPVSLSMALSALRAIHGDGPRWFLAGPHGIMLSHPFFDWRVVRLGLGVQARFRQEPGKQKPLLVHALRDVLPQEILTRRRKGHYNEAYFTGLSRNLPALETMIFEAPDELGMLHKPSLIHHLRQTSLGIESCAAGSARLDLTLSLVKWLSMRNRWETLPLEPPAQTVCIPRRQEERAGS